jgi:protein kinase A
MVMSDDEYHHAQKPAQPTQVTTQMVAKRQKGTYRLTDFIFQRTLGTGSFGRVHLGELDASCVGYRRYR